MDQGVSGHLSQVVHRPGRPVLLQFGGGIAAGSHRQNFGVDVFAAGDVERRIANNEDFFTPQRASEQLAAALAGHDSNLAAILVVVGEGAGAEVVPELVMAELELRAQTDIASEQTDARRLRQRVEVPDQFGNSLEHRSAQLREHVIEPKNVVVEKLRKILRTRFDAVEAEKVADDRGIGAAGEFQFFAAGMHIEDMGENSRESFLAGAAAINEGAVDVE